MVLVLVHLVRNEVNFHARLPDRVSKDLCIVCVRQPLYLLVPFSLMFWYRGSETHWDCSVEMLRLVVCLGIVCSYNDVLKDHMNNNCAKNFNARGGPHSASMKAGIPDRMNKISEITVTELVEDNWVTGMTLVNLMYQTAKIILWWVSDLDSDKGPRIHIATNLKNASTWE